MRVSKKLSSINITIYDKAPVSKLLSQCRSIDSPDRLPGIGRSTSMSVLRKEPFGSKNIVDISKVNNTIERRLSKFLAAKGYQNPRFRKPSSRDMEAQMLYQTKVDRHENMRNSQKDQQSLKYASGKLISIYKDMLKHNITEDDINSKSCLVNKRSPSPQIN